MARTRDEEGLKIASEIADTVDVAGGARQTAVLVGARAFRRGVNQGQEGRDAAVARLEAENASLREQLASAREVKGWSYADLRYIAMLRECRQSAQEIAANLHAPLATVREALRVIGGKAPRNRGPRKPRRRQIDAG